MTQQAFEECRLQWQLKLDPERYTGGEEISPCPGEAETGSRGGEEVATTGGQQPQLRAWDNA